MQNNTIITSTTTVKVAVKDQRCNACKLLKEHLKREHRRQINQNYERFGTIYKTDHGQLQRTSDRIRIVITLPADMKGKAAAFDIETAELVDFIYQGGLNQ